jgi:hypothetical protein
MAQLHESADVGGGGVIGHAAHGDRGAVAVLAPRSEGDLEGPARHLRVLEEHLVEVAHAEEQERARVLGFHAHVLLHGGRLGDGGGQH